MTTELRLLAWTVLLAIVQLFIAAGFKRRQDGLEWARGSRDEPRPPYTGVAGRMQRAEANLMETLPLFAAAVLIAHAAGREGGLSWWGAQLYFWARLIFIPLYASGVSVWRAAVWFVSIAGLLLVLAALL